MGGLFNAQTYDNRVSICPLIGWNFYYLCHIVPVHKVAREKKLRGQITRRPCQARRTIASRDVPTAVPPTDPAPGTLPTARLTATSDASAFS